MCVCVCVCVCVYQRDKHTHSAVKTDSPVATLKKLETIWGANQLSVAPALTVDRYLTVVQRALKLEHNLAFTTTNGDLCVILSVVFSFVQG